MTGLTQRTIRYYEELGLLPAPERTQGDFRLYTARDVHRLSEIARLKQLLGFSLAEIKDFVVANEAREKLKHEFDLEGDPPAGLDELREFENTAAAQLAMLDRKLEQMVELKSELETRLARYREWMEELAPANRRQP